MGFEESGNGLTDVSLCYQAMGVPLDASPVKVEQMYRALAEENKRKAASPDPAVREEARQTMELVNEMYGKIRSSITYHAMEKEHQQKRGAQQKSVDAGPARRVHDAVAEKSLMMPCPRCNGSILKGLKTCPICKTDIYTATDRILKTYFTPVKLVIYCVVLVLVALIVFGVLQTGKDKDGLSEIESLEQKNPPK